MSTERVPKPIRDIQITVALLASVQRTLLLFRVQTTTTKTTAVQKWIITCFFLHFGWPDSLWILCRVKTIVDEVCATATPTASQNANGVVQLALSSLTLNTCDVQCTFMCVHKVLLCLLSLPAPSSSSKILIC